MNKKKLVCFEAIEVLECFSWVLKEHVSFRLVEESHTPLSSFALMSVSLHFYFHISHVKLIQHLYLLPNKVCLYTLYISKYYQSRILSLNGKLFRKKGKGGSQI